MRIAHVTATFPPYHGGTGNVAYHHARVLAARGHAVTVFTAAPAGVALPSHGDAPFPVAYLPVRWRVGNAPYTPGLARALRGFDLIHLHWPFIFGAEMVAAAAHRAHVPLVVTYHNDLLAPGWRGLAFAAYRHLSQPWVLGTADQVVATSLDYARHSDLRTLARRPGRVVAVPNGVDVQQFRPEPFGHTEMRYRWGVPHGSPVVLFVGALDRAHWYKGVPVLIEAMIPHPQAHLMIVGDGDMCAALSRRGEELLGARSHFVGAYSGQELVAAYQVADVVVLPSLIVESFGMVLVEGMACGKPVIASDGPGVRTVVDHGANGLLVAPGRVDVLSAALGSMLADPGLGRAMGVCGRAKAVACYSWDSVVDALEMVYASVLSGCRALHGVSMRVG